MKTQDDIIADFELFDDWMEKYQYIIDLGKDLDNLDDMYKTDGNKLQGCQSQVWITHKLQNNKITFAAASDAAIVAGLIALVLSVYSNKSPTEILQTQPTFISKIGLDKHLSPTRSNGLASLLNRIQETAKLYKAQ
ncbi:MAG: SufE family protein [Proteobacteria bacterium]|nr:SufE family protein [Pseudomonadota bacterium]